MQSIIQIQNLSKSFDGKQVLHDVSFEIPERGIFGVIGLNGTGKTTTIKCLLNLISQHGGTTLLDGKPTSNTTVRRSIAYIPERFSPNPNITGYEYIKAYSNIYKTPVVKEKVDELAKDVGLDLKFLELKTKECSKGTVQKFGIVACLYVNARVVIMDEPTSGLDILARRQLKNALIKQAESKAIVFSSHILSDIEELAQAITVISKGEVIYNGTPASFKERYEAPSVEVAFLKAI